MGLSWSHVTVKNGELIVCYSQFPSNENTRADIWNLWKTKKEDLKKDGFSVSKDIKTNFWKLNYFHTVTDTTYEKTTSGDHLWKHHFNNKLAKWEKFFNDNRQVLSSDSGKKEKSEKKEKKEKPEKKDKHEKKEKYSKKEKKYDDSDDDGEIDDAIVSGILKKYT